MNKTAALRKEYDIALKGKDKRVALDAGRAYYQSLRSQEGKNITLLDEQTIAHDINIMTISNN